MHEIKKVLYVFLLFVAFAENKAFSNYNPHGSYTGSCNSCSVAGSILSCVCFNSSGQSMATSLNLAACSTTSSINNNNGTLTCPEAGNLDQVMQSFWSGQLNPVPIVSMHINTQTNSGQSILTGMNEGTQIVPVSGTWYLFNREYYYTDTPSNCTADFSRIVVRSSTNRGQSWSPEVVVAEPNIAQGECALGDGHAYYDTDTGTWHYIAQMLSGTVVPVSNNIIPGTWYLNHYTLSGNGANPMARFSADSSNPVIRNRQLWDQICVAGKSCPPGTHDEGTPEISYKQNGYFFLSFHGAYSSNGTVIGFRGVAKTPDFKSWITNATDLPNDAVWAGKDCQNWNVPWSSSTGCVGGGHAGTLLTAQYLYMLIESSDIGLGCTSEQNWVAGLARAPANGYVSSGKWQQRPSNPVLNQASGQGCAIQYQRIFQDGGIPYISYWTLGNSTDWNNTTAFHIAQLQTPQQEVNGEFFRILGRYPDAGGIATYVNQISNLGWTVGQLDQALATSQEAQSDLNQVFQTILSRSIDPDSKSNYTMELTNGLMSLSQVWSDVAHSAEAQNDIIQFYQTFVHRAPSPTELQTWASSLALGVTSLSQVEQAVATQGIQKSAALRVITNYLLEQ